MSKTDWKNTPKKLKEEKLTNRVLINFGYILLGYVLLWIFYLYATGRMSIQLLTSYPIVMLCILILFLAGMAACYLLAKREPGLKNYGHMLLGVSAAVFYLNFAFYTRWLAPTALPGPLASFVSFVKNTAKSYSVVAILMLVYLVFMIVYNSFILYKNPAKTAQSKKKSKKQ